VPEESVELVKQGFDAYARGGWEALLPFLHPDFEMTTPPDLAMEPGTYRGEQGMRRYFESFTEAMEDIRFVPTGDFLAAGDRVFVPIRLIARGKETGIEAEQVAFMVWTIRDGRALKVETFASREDALKAAGLPADT
jgi:ketosteroid isomerase-like protein